MSAAADATGPTRPEGPPPGTRIRMPGQAEPQPLHPEEVHRRNVLDIGMVVLGVASLAIVVYDFFWGAALRPDERFALEMADLAIVLVFVAEYVWRWSRAGWRPRFLLQNWFDVLGMVPMVVTNIPIFRAFRLLRVGMVAARLFRMWSFFTGEKSAQLVLNRYRAALVEEVSDLVMLRVLAMTEDIVARGGYTRTLGESLERQRDDLARMAVDSAKANDLGKTLAMVPGFDTAVQQAAYAAVDTVSAALRSEEMQRTFEVTIRGVLAEARTEIERKNWKQAAPKGGFLAGRRGGGAEQRRRPGTPPALPGG